MERGFADRREGGQALAPLLEAYRGRRDALVLGLPRGGVPVAYEIAHALALPLDVLIVRKLGAPGNPELALGAIASGGARYLNDEVVRLTGAGPGEVDRVEQAERAELQRRETLYRGHRPPLDLEHRTVILVDDGIATGASMRAAVRAARAAGASRIVVAVPVAPEDAAERFRGIADEFVCVRAPHGFYAVGQFYRHFDQTGDEEVRELLARAQEEPA